MLEIRPEVYRTYWYFAAERQNIFFRKLKGESHLTDDPILQNYKFCNAYRASDRVSQYLIKQVIYQKNYAAADQLFRIILFRLFNNSATWDYLQSQLGDITLKNFSPRVYSQLLNERVVPIYGNAFILCANKAFGFDRKHDNHLALLEKIFVQSRDWQSLLNAKSLQELILLLKQQPLIGNFMSYQIAIDLNYSPVFNFSENDFTVAGPGALRGIAKAFSSTGISKPNEIIMYMVENQQREFSKLGLQFHDLWGRPLQAIDCQGLFCELDKYSRVKFPQLKSNRQKIKSTYKPMNEKIEYFYPPKWQLDYKVKT